MLFCIQRDNTGLVRAANKVLKNGERLSWLASNSWGDRKQVTDGSEEAGEGALTINYIEGQVDAFRCRGGSRGRVQGVRTPPLR